MLELPFAILLCDQTRLCIVSAGETDKVIASQQSPKAGQGATYQQGFLLPVITEKIPGRKTAQQFGSHRRITALAPSYESPRNFMERRQNLSAVS